MSGCLPRKGDSTRALHTRSVDRTLPIHIGRDIIRMVSRPVQ